MTLSYRLDLTAWVKSVVQAKEQAITEQYLSLVSDEQIRTEQDIARVLQEQHATEAALNNIETQQAITDLMIGGAL